MRSKVVFVLLLAMFASLAGLLAVRPRRARAVAPRPSASSSASPSAATREVALSDGGRAVVSTAVSDAGSASARMERPLRVLALGWELLAPGVLANQGLEPGPASVFRADGLDVRFSAVERASAVEEALARGGGDVNGADVALVPLPVLVSSFERLRALSPEVFYALGFSRGREGLESVRERLLVDERAATGELRVRGEAGDAATFFTLFHLELAGAALGQVQLVAPGSDAARMAAVWAVDRGAEEPPAGAGDAEAPASDRGALPVRSRWSTADAARLIPLVAVAPHALLEQREGALVALLRGWGVGAARLRADVPGGARTLAQVPGAPSTRALLHRLGLFEPASVRDNARFAGLAGRGAVTFERLFARTWRVWRGAGVLSSPQPEALPLATGVVTALARAELGSARAPASSAAPSAAPSVLPSASARGARAVASAGPAGAVPVLVRRFTEARVDEAALLDELGLLAGLYERAALRVSLRGADAARLRALLDAAQARFDLAPERLFSARAVPAGATAAIEVLSAP